MERRGRLWLPPSSRAEPCSTTAPVDTGAGRATAVRTEAKVTDFLARPKGKTVQTATASKTGSPRAWARAMERATTVSPGPTLMTKAKGAVTYFIQVGGVARRFTGVDSSLILSAKAGKILLRLVRR
jgi:hypothetical protein